MSPKGKAVPGQQCLSVDRLAGRASCVLSACLTVTSFAGCSVVSPTPLWELAKATGVVAGAAISMAPSKASSTVYHLHAPFSDVCIEFNPETQVSDVVPALQLELKRHRIESRVYAQGTPPGICPVWLVYAAYVQWDIRPMDDTYKTYMSNATLTLRTKEGAVLSSSAYEPDPTFFRGRWSSTRSKLEPVVTALVTGFEN